MNSGQTWKAPPLALSTLSEQRHSSPKVQYHPTTAMPYDFSDRPCSILLTTLSFLKTVQSKHYHIPSDHRSLLSNAHTSLRNFSHYVENLRENTWLLKARCKQCLHRRPGIQFYHLFFIDAPDFDHPLCNNGLARQPRVSLEEMLEATGLCMLGTDMAEGEAAMMLPLTKL